MRPVIIGAGPAGLSAAYELLKRGDKSVILEASSERVGGLAQTATYKGFRFDIGGHRFFSKSEEIEALWTELLGDDMIVVSRISRIMYGGKLYDYPLKPLNAFLNLGPLQSILCVASYLRAKLWPRQPVVSFEDWVINQFGERLYRIFFKTYTEKVWGIPCDQISADWAAQRIKGLNLAKAVFSALFKQKPGGKVVKTLIDTFRYPRLGPGMMWEKLADHLQSSGCILHMGCSASRFVRGANGIEKVEFLRGDKVEEVLASHVISSMPLRRLVETLDPPPPAAVREASSRLGYRDFLTVMLIVDQPELFSDQWIYIHDPHVKVGRVQNYKSWSPHMVPDARYSCLGLEYFCFAGDGLWNASDDELVALARRELATLHLVDSTKVVDGTVIRMRNAYPVYDNQYRENVRIIREYLDTIPNLQVVGRNGMHRYNNQDHAMMTGLLAARNIHGGQFNLWKVNGDAEYLEESTEDDPEARAVPRRLP